MSQQGQTVVVRKSDLIAKCSLTDSSKNSRNPTAKPQILVTALFMYGHRCSKSMDQPGKVANPARAQLNREMDSLSTFDPESLVSRDGFGSPVLCQPDHLHTQAESGAYLRDSFRFLRWRPCIYLKSP